MALEEIVDSLDKVDSKYIDLYVENSDGKFEVNIAGLKSALNKERLAKKDLEKKLKDRSKDEDSDPDVNDLKNELKTAKDMITNMKINSKLKNAAISAGVDPNYVDDVIQLTKGNFTIGDDGKIVSIDADGNQVNRSIDNFFKIDFRNSKPRFFLNSGKKGTGSHESEDGIPLSFNGKIEKAIRSKNTTELIRLKQTKI
jgi:hypothetical protein